MVGDIASSSSGGTNVPPSAEPNLTASSGSSRSNSSNNNASASPANTTGGEQHKSKIPTRYTTRVSVSERTTASAIGQRYEGPAGTTSSPATSARKDVATPSKGGSSPVTPASRKSIPSKHTPGDHTPASASTKTRAGRSPSPTNALRLSTASYTPSTPHESVITRSTVCVSSHRYDKDKAEQEHLKTEDIWWEQRGVRASHTMKKHIDHSGSPTDTESPGVTRPLTSIAPLSAESHLLKSTHAVDASKYHHEEVKHLDPKSIPPLPETSHLNSSTAAFLSKKADAPPPAPTDPFKPTLNKKLPIYEHLHSKLLEPTVSTAHSVYVKKPTTDAEEESDKDAFGVAYVFSADKTLLTDPPLPPKSAAKSEAFKNVHSKLMAPTRASIRASWRSQGSSTSSPSGESTSIPTSTSLDAGSDIHHSSSPSLSPRAQRRRSSLYDNVPSKLMATTAACEHGKASPVQFDTSPAFKPGGVQKAASADSFDAKAGRRRSSYANVKSRLHQQTKAMKFGEWGYEPKKEEEVEFKYSNKGKYDGVSSRLHNPTRASICGTWSPKQLEQDPNLALYGSPADVDATAAVAGGHNLSSPSKDDSNPFLVKLRRLSVSPELGRASLGSTASQGSPRDTTHSATVSPAPAAATPVSPSTPVSATSPSASHTTSATAAESSQAVPFTPVVHSRAVSHSTTTASPAKAATTTNSSPTATTPTLSPPDNTSQDSPEKIAKQSSWGSLKGLFGTVK